MTQRKRSEQTVAETARKEPSSKEPPKENQRVNFNDVIRRIPTLMPLSVWQSLSPQERQRIPPDCIQHPKFRAPYRSVLTPTPLQKKASSIRRLRVKKMV